MTRARNAAQRRQLIKTVADAKRKLTDLQSQWDVSSTVYLTSAQRAEQGTTATYRDRRPDEYPEEDARYWAMAYNTAEALIAQLADLKETAERRYFEIKDAGADRAVTPDD